MADWTFRRVTRADFDLLASWLSQPAVARWWVHEWTPEAIERDFGPTVDGREPNQDWLGLYEGVPLGLVQRSLVSDYEENERDFRMLGGVPDGAVTLDYLLGERRGEGLGPQMVSAMVDRTWGDCPDCPAVVVSVVAANVASWRALEKVGFRRAGAGDLEPDNPKDDPMHHLLRLDRPNLRR
ncbi:MAG TPA: GNAT family N-acetyltransferase [Nitriliruptoraceae bacterium]|nr:GNAT family N-acetyltransferase [Nitriliruptoraceae bacterium]